MSRRGQKKSAYFEKLKENIELYNTIKEKMIKAKKDIIPKLLKEKGKSWYTMSSEQEFKDLVLSNADEFEEKAKERIMVSLLSHRSWMIDNSLDWWDMYLFLVFPPHTEKRNRVTAIKNFLKEL